MVMLRMHFEISPRQDNIVSATGFDFDAYHKWNPNKAKEPGKGRTAMSAPKTQSALLSVSQQTHHRDFRKCLHTRRSYK
jgi:hypothetical protein